MRHDERVLDRLFLEHPRSVDESYGEHFRASAGIGVVMIGAGLACLVHALVPALCRRTGSSTIRRLHGRLGGRAGEPGTPGVEAARV